MTRLLLILAEMLAAGCDFELPTDEERAQEAARIHAICHKAGLRTIATDYNDWRCAPPLSTYPACRRGAE